jgi:hypothetical protein
MMDVNAQPIMRPGVDRSKCAGSYRKQPHQTFSNGSILERHDNAEIMAMNEAGLNLAIIARTGGKGQQSLADGNWKAVAVSPLTSIMILTRAYS